MKIKKSWMPLLLLFALPAALFAQQVALEYSASVIPDSLRKGGDAVLLYGRTEFTYNSVTSASLKVTEAVTVLNQAGEKFAHFSQYADDDCLLKSFSGSVYDAAGRQLRKIKKSDLEYSEYSPSLATDGKTYFYYAKSASYPYTVVYEYEMAMTDAILAFPTFYPTAGYGQGVRKAEYILQIPPEVGFSWRGFNLDPEPEKQTVKDRDVYTWTVENIPPIVNEPFSPDILPRLMLIPEEFAFGKTKGSLESWERLGEWQCDIMKGRDELPPELKNKIREMTASAASDREKVEILYKYLGETTRYVSIQIGIGGLQPMTASEVYKQKFGDCKALSNYMKAMLQECGIESYYTVIHSGARPRSVIADFPHRGITNHAVLCVALDDGPLWLECTAPKLPFGYIHSSISGRHAVSHKDNVGHVVYIPRYADSLNVTRFTADLSLDEGSNVLKGHVSICYGMQEYEALFSKGFAEMDSRQRLDHVSKGIGVPLSEITNISFREEKTSSPASYLEYDIVALPNVTGSRIFLPTRLSGKGSARKLPRTRKQDIQIFNGYRKTENITISVPEKFLPETIPADVALDSEFGRYRSQVRFADGKLKIYRELLFNSGRYDVSRYSGFRKFVEDMSADDAAAIILKLKE